MTKSSYGDGRGVCPSPTMVPVEVCVPVYYYPCHNKHPHSLENRYLDSFTLSQYFGMLKWRILRNSVRKLEVGRLSFSTRGVTGIIWEGKVLLMAQEGRSNDIKDIKDEPKMQNASEVPGMESPHARYRLVNLGDSGLLCTYCGVQQ